MGSPGSPVETPRWAVSGPGTGYERLEGPVPLSYAPRLAKRAREVHGYLERGSRMLAEILGTGPPNLRAILVADEDWDGTPREGGRPYPPGLPYFTRSTNPPSLVLPAALSLVFRPRTEATLPLVVWHELAHAFLLGREVVRMPVWLGEFVPQAASAAVARRVGLPLDEHLERVDHNPGFTVRRFEGPASAEDQMKFQNLLLLFGAAALAEFGEGFLGRLFRALWEQDDVVDGGRAEELLAGSLGPGGAAWLSSRPEF